MNLSSTLGSFATRLKKQVALREEALSEQSKIACSRRALMMQSITSIRRSLQDASKLSLGERFCFKLDVIEYDGWPGIDFLLVDKEGASVPTSLKLVVRAYERDSGGIIQLASGTGEVLGRGEVNVEGDLPKLALTLKRSIRRFLDSVTAYVLDPADIVDTPKIEITEVQQTVDPIEKKLSHEEFFTADSDLGARDKLVEVSDQEIIPLGLALAFGKSG